MRYYFESWDSETSQSRGSKYAIRWEAKMTAEYLAQSLVLHFDVKLASC